VENRRKENERLVSLNVATQGSVGCGAGRGKGESGEAFRRGDWLEQEAIEICRCEELAKCQPREEELRR
jgi:hypothetical protein